MCSSAPRGALLAEPGTCCRGGARGGGTGYSLAWGNRLPGGESRAPALRALLLLGLRLPVPGGRGSLGGWAHLVEEQLLWIFFFLGGILAVQSETAEMHNLQSKSLFIYALLRTGLFICKPSSLVWLERVCMSVCVCTGSVCAWVSVAWGEQMGD